jgi:hypothetical protein
MSEDPVRWFRELDAANVGGYTILIYETWVGDREDPATQVEEWMSLFNEEDMPDEVSTATEVANSPPYVPSTRYTYRGYSGLQGAVTNEQLRVVQEADYAAQKQRSDSESLLGDTYYGRSASVGGVNYEAFLNAIERVGANDDDEEAWAAIEKWRSRQMRQEEREVV